MNSKALNTKHDRCSRRGRSAEHFGLIIASGMHVSGYHNGPCMRVVNMFQFPELITAMKT